MAQDTSTTNLKDLNLDIKSIESLSFKDKELIYNGTLRLCQGFLSHPSYWSSTATAFLRLGILTASRKALITTAALIAKDCGLLNDKNLILKNGDESINNIDDLVGNIQDTSDPKGDMVSQDNSGSSSS